MVFSSLIKSSRVSTKRSSRGVKKPQRLIIHHIAGSGSAAIGHLYNPSVKASANYILMENGDFLGMVPEEYRAWTSGSAAVDSISITVETANTTFSPSWKVSDASLESLAQLAADCSRRYGWGKLNRTNIRGHREFANTACPGPYLYPRLQQIADRANEILAGNKTPSKPKPVPSKPSPKPTPSPSSGSLVKVNTASLNYRSGPGVQYAVKGAVKKGEVYTIVETKNGWGKLKSGAGWINLGYTLPHGAASKTPAKKSETAIAKEVVQGKWGNGTDRQNRLKKAGYNAANIQKIVNKLL